MIWQVRYGKNTDMVNARVVKNLMFRLLPIQIPVAMAGTFNGIVSSYFAGNYVGIEAMTAVGLYSPLKH